MRISVTSSAHQISIQITVCGVLYRIQARPVTGRESRRAVDGHDSTLCACGSSVSGQWSVHRPQSTVLSGSWHPGPRHTSHVSQYCHWTRQSRRWSAPSWRPRAFVDATQPDSPGWTWATPARRWQTLLRCWSGAAPHRHRSRYSSASAPTTGLPGQQIHTHLGARNTDREARREAHQCSPPTLTWPSPPGRSRRRGARARGIAS